MANLFHHEAIYRGDDGLRKLAAARLTLCGAGALGSHLADNLVRQGFGPLRVIDRDRVEEHNVGTQLYGTAEVGAWKVEALRNRLFRATGVEIVAIAKELTTTTTPRLLKGAELVVDVFDNHGARQLVQEQCRKQGATCLHVGLFADYAEVIWDEHYKLPADVPGDVCDYPLARNLVLATVALASETLVSYVLSGERLNRSLTLRDFTVRALELPTR
jgi:molybdopterin/thiamine biosynthesis adenylyltransferase